MKLSASTSQQNVEKWEKERQDLEEDRIHDHSVADKFFKQDLTQGTDMLPRRGSSDMRVVPSRKETELKLLEEEALNPQGRGLVKAIVDSMDVQISQ